MEGDWRDGEILSGVMSLKKKVWGLRVGGGGR